MPESISRRMFMRRAGVVAGVGLAGALAPIDAAAGAVDAIEAAPPTAPQIGPRGALRLLMEGNRRWVLGRARHPHQSVQRRRQRAAAQSPFAVVYSCIDSRVPPEIVFDRGIGVAQLRREPTLAPRVTAGKLMIVGGHYSLPTGRVQVIA